MLFYYTGVNRVSSTWMRTIYSVVRLVSAMDILRCASPLPVIQEVPILFYIFFFYHHYNTLSAIKSYFAIHVCVGVYYIICIFTCFKCLLRAYSSVATNVGMDRTSTVERCCRFTVLSNNRWRFLHHRKKPFTYWHRVSC